MKWAFFLAGEDVRGRNEHDSRRWGRREGIFPFSEIPNNAIMILCEIENLSPSLCGKFTYTSMLKHKQKL